MTTDNGREHGGDEDEVQEPGEPSPGEPPVPDEPPLPNEPPPPKIIKIEDAVAGADIGSFLEYADTTSRYDALDGDLLKLDEAVAVVRLDSDYVTGKDGEGVLVGETITDLSSAINELAGTYGLLRVRRLEFKTSMDIVFTTTGAIEQTLEGPRSKELQGAERLKGILGSRDPEDLLERLGRVAEPFVPRLEHLLGVLYENRATLDIQTPRSRPLRVGPERAVAIYGTLRNAAELPPEHIKALGKLVGAISDTRDFKLRLDEPWKGKRVIDGKFADGLEPAVERFFNRIVLARILVVGEHRPGRPVDRRFILEGLDAPPELQHQLPM